MAKEVELARDWRSADAYRSLLNADAAAWAWEFARRAQRGPRDGDCAPWDLCYGGVGPGCGPAPTAMWRHESDPSVPVFQYRAASVSDPDAVDLGRISQAVLVVTDRRGDQHILIAEGLRRLRLAVVGGDMLQGPARLGFELPPTSAGAASLDAVRRLLILRDSGRLAPANGRSRRRSLRWAEALAAFDARRRGASQRDIADLIFGADRVCDDWNGRSDYMRMRVQRLLRTAEALVAGGYRALCGLCPSETRAREPVKIWRSAAWSMALTLGISLWTLWGPHAGCTVRS